MFSPTHAKLNHPGFSDICDYPMNHPHGHRYKSENIVIKKFPVHSKHLGHGRGLGLHSCSIGSVSDDSVCFRLMSEELYGMHRPNQPQNSQTGLTNTFVDNRRQGIVFLVVRVFGGRSQTLYTKPT